MSSPLDDFVAVSAALTGYSAAELHGTGMAETYLAHVTAIVGEAFAARLWEVGHDVVHRAGHDLETEVGLRLLDDPNFGPVARNLIVLWYTGQWVQLPASGVNATAPTPTTSTSSSPPTRTPRVWSGTPSAPIRRVPRHPASRRGSHRRRGATRDPAVM